jgi:hypothetical protein
VTDIVIVNRSTVLTDAEIEKAMPAFQDQVTHDWLPHWPGRGATLHFAGKDAAVPKGMWPLYVLDHTDVPGAGGYHDDDNNLPQGKVFAADAMEYGEHWTVDLSHELLEMLGDPTTNTIIAIPRSPLHCLQEVCDAVEADQYGYERDGVLLSDFVLPGYFTGHLGTNEPPHAYDFKGHLRNPVPSLLHGGYLGIQLPDGEWTQIIKRRADNKKVSRRADRSGRSVRYQ